MRNAKRVSVHVVTDDPQVRLPDLLATLDGQTCRDVQVIVVDNASGSRPGVLAEAPHVATLRNPRRQSWSRAMNQAAALALSRWDGQELGDRYIVTASPDVLFSPEAVEEALRAFEQDALLMVAVPKLLRAARLPSEDGQGDWDFGTDVASMGIRLTRGRQPVILLRDDREPFAPMPQCFLLRASALRALGDAPFDERLSPVPAAIDLAWRVRRQGGGVRLAQNVVAWIQPGSQTAMWADGAERSRTEIELQRVERANDVFANRFFHAPWIFFERLFRAARRLLHPGAWRGWLIATVGPVLRPRGEDAVAAADQARWFA